MKKSPSTNNVFDNEKEEAEVSSSEDIDDPEYLELCERGEIVDKYDKGPDSKDVDPWENPDFELYKVTDRYGFIHKNSPPTDAGKDAKERERKRDQKWYRMVLEWNKRFPVKLKERIWKGVPDKLRSDVWQRLLGSKELKLAAGTNTYRELLMRAKLISKDIKQIDLDINRTYRDNLAFRRRYDVKQRSLFNVLSAYAMYNTEVGYCQGMSQIAALFLLYMDEEEAFWCLHSLMVEKKFTMHGFFVPGFPKLHRFQDHYEKILQKYLPRLKKHFDKFGIPPIYLTKWWFGCFLDRVPFSLALRIWDIFIFQGDSILLAMSYNIMKMHQKTIRKFQMENFMEFIQNGIAQDFGYPSDKVMESLEDCLRRLQSDKMDQPPPPPAGAPSEVPTKPLGPVLSRSMINIEMDIAEIQSRCSRANSLAGTPSMTRHQHSKKSAARTPKMAHSLQSTIEHRLENIHGRNNEWHVNSKKSPSTELGYDKVLPNINNMHIVPSHSKKPHEFGENFNRQKDTTITDNHDESQAMFPRMQRPAEERRSNTLTKI
uniref:Rab-GAP TBC domain-containing protein n=1 Tax=Acrobeloides nanus TaxID=290746 RepID=A0A914BX47_9BILA